MEREHCIRISEEELQTYSDPSNRKDSTVNVCEEKETDLQDLAKEFAALKVSVSGISNIVESRSIIRRYLWFICVVVATIFMGYMTTKVVLEYLSYPKMMIIEDTIQHKLPFPAVTICSLNPISNTYINKTFLKKIISLKKFIESTKAGRKPFTGAMLLSARSAWAHLFAGGHGFTRNVTAYQILASPNFAFLKIALCAVVCQPFVKMTPCTWKDADGNIYQPTKGLVSATKARFKITMILLGDNGFFLDSRQIVYSSSAASSRLNWKFFNTVKAIRTLELIDGKELRHVNYSLQKGMLGVNVYFNSFEVSRQSEVSSYSWETLMANIGGNLGFFMGFTLITFLELAEFIWDSILAVVPP
ncbi:hypothetical protein AVEN_83445-1 [Araneus ventricosus]|uniref:Uncharacterized protein n=1 Tax=Araneus ventricosus TaxID=182803 RepID=A0A4Y2N1X4_ARAVE|nr:hypothetical protein AVEN_83445-1 [Araneus ventricosus]